MLVSASDATDEFVLAGSLGVGARRRSAIGVTVPLITKDTQASIGDYATDRRRRQRLHARTSVAYAGTIDGSGGFPKLGTFRGVAVLAYSSED